MPTKLLTEYIVLAIHNMNRMFRLIVIFSLLSGSAFAKITRTDSLGVVTFKDCKIKKRIQQQEIILGVTQMMSYVVIDAKQVGQAECKNAGTGEQKMKTFTNRFSVSHTYDSTGILCKALLEEIRKYWEEIREFEKKYPPRNSAPGDFSHLPRNSGFYVFGGNVFPYTGNDFQGKGGVEIFMIGRHFYKVESLKTKGLGPLNSFILQNLIPHYNGKPIVLYENKSQLNDILNTIDQYNCFP